VPRPPETMTDESAAMRGRETGESNRAADGSAEWFGSDGEERDADHAPRDLLGAFIADVSHLNLLTREEEEFLAAEIARRRDCVSRLLRRQRRWVGRALAGAGRATVHPDRDFREREALMVLAYVRERLCATPRSARGAKAQRAFVRDLAREIDAYRAVRDRMMTANVRLVMSLARRYRHPVLSYLDLVQEGMLGLLRAVEKYDPNRGTKFGTYAVWWIWQQIARAADCQGAMIRTPVHWNQFRRRVGRSTCSTDAASIQESVARAYGVPTERAMVMAQSFRCLSLATPLDEEGDRTVGDTLAMDSAVGPEGVVMDLDLGERLALAVGELPPREAQILRLRFGLAGARTCTLEEIGDRFGVSRERIRQLEARALKRIRVICDERGLAELLH